MVWFYKKNSRRQSLAAKSSSRRRIGKRNSVWVGLLSAAVTLLAASPQRSEAAEKITLSLGATVERSISVESLSLYVNEGIVSEDLEPYVRFIERRNPEALGQARELLSQRIDVDVTTVAQFAYTPQGGYLLDELGQIVRTGARLPGGQGLRGAAILSAADTQRGLTLLNVIERFPTPVMRVDLRRGLAVANRLNETFRQSSAAISLVEQLSLATQAEPFPPGQSANSLLAMANQPGAYQVRRFPRLLKASPAPVDIYLPQTLFPEALPTIIISHGLGNERKTYSYLARYLASHGYGVINVEHPGSSAEQFDALVLGRTNQVVPDDEFVERPLLIRRVLDELSDRAVTDKALAQLDINNVGIIGQSFGGYTALAVAGAPVDLDSLALSCPPELTLNVSLFLQCQAMALAGPQQNVFNFRDPRIRAVVAINPMTSAILGEKSISQVNVPVLMLTSSADTIAPALAEQIRPFSWLQSPNRYLLLMDGATHFSTMGITGEETFDLPPSVIGPVPEVAQRYTEIMSLAFLNTYIRGDNRYQPMLTSGFTQRLSDPRMPLSLISSLDGVQLNQVLRLAEDLIDEDNTPIATADSLSDTSADNLTDIERAVLEDLVEQLAQAQPLIQQ